MTRRKALIIFVAIILITMILLTASCALFVSREKTNDVKIVIVHLDGIISDGSSDSLYGESSSILVKNAFREISRDKGVKAVVLRINSPGGTVAATQEIADEILRLRTSGVPVVTSMGDVAASGGYWLAACTDKIYANPGTITGSIGVYISWSNWQELYKKIGIKGEIVKSGPYKDILSDNREMTTQERAILQTMVNDLYDQFVSVVANGRKMDDTNVRRLADGRIYIGSQAKANGLIDDLGDCDAAVKAAKSIANVPEDTEVKEYKGNGIFSLIFSARSNLLGLGELFANKHMFLEGIQNTQQSFGLMPLVMMLP